MTKIGRIVTAITGSPAPVLFLDSCILLDIVRTPLRNKASEVRVATQFLASVRKAPKTIHLLIASPTPTEWNDHIGEAVTDCTTAVNSCNAVASICAQIALPGVAFLPAAVLNLPTMLRQLSADLLASAVTIDHSAAALGRAVDRIIASTHPAKPGGKGAKDSVILEHAVETTDKLRTAGFTGITLFVSSNTADFAAKGSTNLHAQLVPAFNPVSLQYAVSLEDAESILTAAGWAP
ncbi:MAG: hypothetical protein HYS12_09510 [Planctomycetes bacterium]|nr:hypothetical protein [Planctomycetota bacterium]